MKADAKVKLACDRRRVDVELRAACRRGCCPVLLELSDQAGCATPPKNGEAGVVAVVDAVIRDGEFEVPALIWMFGVNVAPVAR